MSFPGGTGRAAGSSTPSGYELSQVSNFTPQQMQLFQSLLGNLMPHLGGSLGFLGQLAGGQEAAFEKQEAPAYAAFNKAVGQLGSRYSGLGARDSSAFQNAIGGQASQLAQMLQGQRSQTQQNAIDRLLGLSGSLLSQRPYENILTPKDQGFDFGSLLGTAGPALLQSLPALLSLFGGPAGAAAGAGAGAAYSAGRNLFT